MYAAQVLVNPFADNPQAAADGAKVFLTTCATCHGRNGEGAEAQVEGVHPPDLTRGEFRAGKGDDDLFRVISEGVQGTPMPSFGSLGPDQIWRLVVFVRSLSNVTPVLNGNPANGEMLFRGKGGCGGCHQMEGRGGRRGPDLTRGSSRTNSAEKLLKAIVEPDDDIAPGFAVITVITRDNRKITGVQRWLDNFSTRLIDDSGEEHTFLRDEVKSVSREMRSIMPADYGQKFSAKEIGDVVAYIQQVQSKGSSRQ
jgi:putative heme-binding domain-containing protein